MSYGIRYEDLDPTLKIIIDGKLDKSDILANTSLMYVATTIATNNITLPHAPISKMIHIITASLIDTGSQINIKSTENAVSITRLLSTTIGKPVTRLTPGYHRIIIIDDTNATLLDSNGTPNISGVGISQVVLSGVALFNGNTGRVITHNLNINPANYQVFITPNENGNGSIGEYHVDKSLNSFSVVITGDVNNKSFGYIMTI